MSNRQNSKKKAGRPERRIRVRAVRRDPPDLKKLSQALIALAMAQAEKEAQQAKEGRPGGGERRSA